MKTTHLSRKAIAIVAIIASSFCFASPALAGNSAKTGWSAYLTNWQTSDTPNRQKQNSSDGFISASSVSGGRTIRAWMLGYSRGCAIRYRDIDFRILWTRHQSDLSTVWT